MLIEISGKGFPPSQDGCDEKGINLVRHFDFSDCFHLEKIPMILLLYFIEAEQILSYCNSKWPVSSLEAAIATLKWINTDDAFEDGDLLKLLIIPCYVLCVIYLIDSSWSNDALSKMGCS